MLKYDTIKSTDEQFVMQTYKRLPALFVQGAGCTLWDNRGNEYLDMLAGIAVCNLGHCHPAVVSAITRQAQQLIHVSNFGLTAPQAQLAKRLCEISGMDKAFFVMCGASANETALKIAKKHGLAKRPDGDYEIITLHRSFHGRTLGALSATGQRKYQRPFEPLIPGFKHVEANDIPALKEAVGHKTAAIVLEPIQGEGGVLPLTTEFLKTARELCDEYGAFLVLDEVQTGIGRTGEWFCYQIHEVVPDVLCLAKGLGGGVPIGVCLAKGKAADVLEAGDHGATFGGNPLSCAAGLAVLDAVEHYDLRQNAKSVGAYLVESLRALGGPIKTVRGYGLMIGAILDEPIAREIVAKAFDKRLIINATDEYSLRFVPPLIMTHAQVDHAIAIIADVMGLKAPAMAVQASHPTPAKPAYHDILSIDDLSNGQLEEVLDLASFLKQRRKLAPSVITPIEGRSVALVFEKPSLRTRVSFETAIRELGGHPIYLSKADIGMNSRESARDIASNLARWCNMIVARLYWQKDLQLLAEVADVPVVNALTEMEHPCQALADMQTIQENFGQDKVKITYVGDGNNVSRSLAKVATRLGYPMTICGPANFRLEDMPGLTQTDDLEEGLSDAQVVYTDVWISMGDEHEQEHRLKVFDAYQVDARVMEMAAKESIFLHCLPARRGYEVTDEVIDGKQSRIVDQAENRLHAQKALLQLILGL
ncbi:MAG: acetylornithine transaminase [Fimbriimonadaceae bacterium]|nr:acetylornithine transaminase [Fimbriimonadaceae bacterium]